jgi:hypothetical protein
MQNLPEPLRAMASYSQFIVWASEWDEKKKKYQKYTVDPHQRFRIDSSDPANWMDFETASAVAQVTGLGVGFVFTRNDPFFFVDIDGAFHNGQWSPFAVEVWSAFSGCATEVSMSGTGLHFFGVGNAPIGHRCRRDDIGLEFYTEGRFVALTGTSAVGDSGFPAQASVDWLLAKYLPERVGGAATDWTTEPVAAWEGPDDDDELLKRMLRSKSASAVFGGKAPVTVLWEADEAELAKYYPSVNEDVYDRSKADAALMQHLAFWTGKNCERMQRLFERSGLIRDKWIQREDYREDTITKACGICTAVYAAPKKEKAEIAEYVASTEQPIGVLREGYQLLTPSNQLVHFKDCVYVAREHSVKVPSGELWRPDTFRAMYGGYWFSLDTINDKLTKSAWEAFTESQAVRFPRADATCFRPELPPNSLVTEEGRTFVNVYVPVETPRVEGDPTLFILHLHKLLPSEKDRNYLMGYLAACVQMPGVKFRWCPFVQGVPGNGKTTLWEIVERAIGRRYSHSPSANDIANKFNDWLEYKLFIYVNDIYTADRMEVMEILKPMITDRRIEVQPKGGAKYMADNRGNFVLNSNFKNGVPKTANDRRIAPFFTAQQEESDLIRDGMNDAYFQRLNNWLENENGYAVCAHYLANYKIADEFNPALMSRAPFTGSTAEAVASSLGGIEQEIMESVAQGLQGFQNGWISSVALDRLIENRRDSRKLPPNRRKDVLLNLGYIPHPHLPDGRCTTPVAIDGGRKPRLYIREGHISANLTTNSAIVDAYVRSQEIGGLEITAEIFKAK